MEKFSLKQNKKRFHSLLRTLLLFVLLVNSPVLSKAQLSNPGTLVTVNLGENDRVEDVLLSLTGGSLDSVHSITNMKIVGGKLTTSDFWFLTEHMLYGPENQGKGNLQRLDIAEVGSVYENTLSYDMLSSTALKELIVPNTVEILDGNAFMNSKIEYLTIGKNTREVCGSLFGYDVNPSKYYSAFANMNYLKKVFVAEGNTHFKAIDGVLYSSDGKTLYAFPATHEKVEFTIPQDVKELAPCSFMGDNLRKIDLGSVEIVGANAFSNFHNLEEIIWGNNLKIIGPMAFNRIIIDGTETHIDKNRRNIVLPEGLEYIGREAFYPSLGIETMTLPSSIKTIGNGAFAGDGLYYSNLIKLDLSKCKELKAIPEQMCYYVNTLTDILWPQDGVLTDIGYGAFLSCSALKKVNLPASVENIGQMAFFMYDEIHPTMLEEVRLGKNVKKIEANAFGKLLGLKRFFIDAVTPPAVDEEGPTFVYTPVGDAVLYVPASSVEQYKVAQDFSKFGQIVGFDSFERTETGMGLNLNAFKNATHLKNIYLPKNTEYVEEGAFEGCTMLENVYIAPSTPDYFGENAFPDQEGTTIWVSNQEMKSKLDGQFGFQSTQVKVVESSGLHHIEKAQQCEIKINNHLLTVISHQATQLNIFSILGNKVVSTIIKENSPASFYLEEGIYLVTTNKESHKVIIK